MAERGLREARKTLDLIEPTLGGQTLTLGRGRGDILTSLGRAGTGGMDHTYFAEISWDGEAGVWHVLDTGFPGLVAEAASERDLVEEIRGLAPELYEVNRHLFEDRR